MKRLSPKQRDMLGEKLADLGNLAVGSLVFGVVLRAEAFTRGTVVLGILIAIAAYWFAVNLEK
jgi:hypothetical protein